MSTLEYFRQVSLNLRQATTLADMLMLVGVIVLLVLAGIWFTRYYPRLRRRGEHRELFDELCRAHQLSGAERRLLEEISEQEGLQNKLQLFIQKSILERRVLASSGVRRERLAALAKRLYD